MSCVTCLYAAITYSQITSIRDVLIIVFTGKSITTVKQEKILQALNFGKISKKGIWQDFIVANFVPGNYMTSISCHVLSCSTIISLRSTMDVASFPGPRPASSHLQYGKAASNGKLGKSLGTRLQWMCTKWKVVFKLIIFDRSTAQEEELDCSRKLNCKDPYLVVVT